MGQCCSRDGGAQLELEEATDVPVARNHFTDIRKAGGHSDQAREHLLNGHQARNGIPQGGSKAHERPSYLDRPSFPPGQRPSEEGTYPLPPLSLKQPPRADGHYGMPHPSSQNPNTQGGHYSIAPSKPSQDGAAHRPPTGGISHAGSDRAAMSYPIQQASAPTASSNKPPPTNNQPGVASYPSADPPPSHDQPSADAIPRVHPSFYSIPQPAAAAAPPAPPRSPGKAQHKARVPPLADVPPASDPIQAPPRIAVAGPDGSDGARGAAFSPTARPAFVPKLPLKEKGIEGQFGHPKSSVV